MRTVLPVFIPLLIAGALSACSTTPPRTDAAPATTPLLRISDGDGDNPVNAYRLGRTYERQGDLVRAGAAYARSLALDPAQLDARNAQAVLLARQGQLTEAADLLRRLAADFPTQAQPLSNLGYVYYLQGDTTQAATTLRAALTVAPDYGPARANLALVETAGGRPSATDNAVSLATAASVATSATAASAASVTTANPAAIVAPATTVSRALTLAATPSLELVQLAPNEFRLQAPAAGAGTAGTAARVPAAPAALAATGTASADGYGADAEAAVLTDAHAVAGTVAAAATRAAAGTGASTRAETVTVAAATAATTEPERLQIVNGNGVPGLAGKVRGKLKGHGFAAASVTNQRGYRQAATLIEYVPGQRARARALRAALGGGATLAPVAALPRQLTLRLVLGQDRARALAPALAPSSVPTLALIRATPATALAQLDRAAPEFNQESP